MFEWNILSKLFMKMSKSEKMKLIYLIYFVIKFLEIYIGVVFEVIDCVFV